MTTVKFGNVAPYMQRDGNAVPAEHMQQTVTTVTLREDWNNEEENDLALSTPNDRMLTMIARSLGKDKRYAIAILEMDQIVMAHSAQGPAYVWVDDDPEFAKVLAKHFDCPAVDEEPSMLLTNGGRDLLHSQGFNTSAPAATSNYIAVTANASAAVATDTTLTAEIATAGGGLLRAQATYAHTGGTNTTTLTKTFTANGSDSLPVTLAKIGVFNASTSGTMTFETLLNATATLTTSGDNVAITETITLG